MLVVQFHRAITPIADESSRVINLPIPSMDLMLSKLDGGPSPSALPKPILGSHRGPTTPSQDVAQQLNILMAGSFPTDERARDDISPFETSLVSQAHAAISATSELVLAEAGSPSLDPTSNTAKWPICIFSPQTSQTVAMTDEKLDVQQALVDMMEREDSDEMLEPPSRAFARSTQDNPVTPLKLKQQPHYAMGVGKFKS